VYLYVIERIRDEVCCSKNFDDEVFVIKLLYCVRWTQKRVQQINGIQLIIGTLDDVLTKSITKLIKPYTHQSKINRLIL